MLALFALYSVHSTYENARGVVGQRFLKISYLTLKNVKLSFSQVA